MPPFVNCAYVLRISGWSEISGFLKELAYLYYTNVFFRGLARAIRIQGNRAFFGDNLA